MADDIVTRLRDWKRAADRSGFGSLLGIFDEAADEIERLRRNTGCARNQGTTQFCAEALDAQRAAETLKTKIFKNADEFRETLTELRQRVETLTAERDEARQGKTDAR
jgi:phage shock protein A